MSDPDGMVLARVIITRVLATDGSDIIDHVIAEDREGDELGLAEALGMMELAKFTLISARLYDADDE